MLTGNLGQESCAKFIAINQKKNKKKGGDKNEITGYS